MSTNLIYNPSISNQTWFDEFIATIRTNQLQLETDTTLEDLKRMYNILFSGNERETILHLKATADQYYIKSITVEYLHEISSKMPLKRAFDLDDSEVLVWAEIENDNEVIEDFLLLTEASINARFHQFGYDLSSTIVETRDRLSIPNHYKVFKN
jgi:hypothetical protein